MNSAKRFLMVAGAFALATLTFTLANPKVVDAFAATLVQVSNTYSNPAAVTRADNDGRSPVQLFFGEEMPAGTAQDFNPLIDSATQAPFTVPAGKRLVVDQVSEHAEVPTGQAFDVFLINSFPGGSTPIGTGMNVPPPAAIGSFFPGYTSYANTIQARGYAEPGQQYSVSMSRNNGSGGFFWNVEVVGHLVDCTNGGGC